MLVFSNSDELEIVGYKDPDFAGDPNDMKLTSGYVFKMAGGFHGKESKRLLPHCTLCMQNL